MMIQSNKSRGRRVFSNFMKHPLQNITINNYDSIESNKNNSDSYKR